MSGGDLVARVGAHPLPTANHLPNTGQDKRYEANYFSLFSSRFLSSHYIFTIGKYLQNCRETDSNENCILF